MKKALSLLLGICVLIIVSRGAVDLTTSVFHIFLMKENELEAQQTGGDASKIPGFDHIVLIVMENRSYDEVVGNPSSPYINSLIKKYALAADYYGLTHPSLPNYIALLGGSMFGIHKNCMNCLIKETNLMDQIDKSRKTWKAYFESLPNPCFLGTKYPYTRLYNSFVYFSDIIKNQKRCKQIVPFGELTQDMKSLSATPNFIWISPNLCHDTHNCSPSTGDKWLSVQIPKILASPAFIEQNSLLIITWDEAERKGKNHIPTILVGKSVKRGFISYEYYNHYSLLHTIEASWTIPPISANAKKSSVMSDFFKNVH